VHASTFCGGLLLLVLVLLLLHGLLLHHQVSLLLRQWDMSDVGPVALSRVRQLDHNLMLIYKIVYTARKQLRVQRGKVLGNNALELLAPVDTQSHPQLSHNILEIMP